MAKQYYLRSGEGQFHHLSWHQKDTSKLSQTYHGHCLIEVHSYYSHFCSPHTSKSAYSLQNLKNTKNFNIPAHRMQVYTELQKSRSWSCKPSGTFWKKAPYWYPIFNCWNNCVLHKDDKIYNKIKTIFQFKSRTVHEKKRQ